MKILEPPKLPVGTQEDVYRHMNYARVRITLPDGRTAEAEAQSHWFARREAARKLGL